MAMSVPGNSCCSSPTNLPSLSCPIKVYGKCVIYSGSNVSNPSIKVGDTYDSIIVKLAEAIAEAGSGSVTSVALSMPSAFSVSGSPITSAGTFTVTGAGTSSQFIAGDGSLGDVSNGLTLGSGELKLGGALTEPTSITSSVAANTLSISGVNTDTTSLLGLTTTGSGYALGISYTTGRAIDIVQSGNNSGRGVSVYTYGGEGFRTDTFGGYGLRVVQDNMIRDMVLLESNNHINGAYSVNSRINVVSVSNLDDYTAHIRLMTLANGTPLVGFGSAISFGMKNTTGAERRAGEIFIRWEDPTNGSETSSFGVTLIDTGNTNRFERLVLHGNGRLTLNGYGEGNFTSGTPLYLIAVDADGNLMETTDFGPTDSFYTIDGTLSDNRTVDADGFLLQFNNVNIFRVTEGDDTEGGTYEFNSGVDLLSYDSSNSSNLIMNPVSGITFEYTELAGPSVVSSFSVNGSGSTFGGNITATSLATGGSAPVTSGDTKMVISDEDGLLSFTDIPTGGDGTVTEFAFTDGSGFAGTVDDSTTTPTLSLTTSLTTGSVPFIGASGALSEDNSNLFWDNTNKRLGIGTSSPTSPVDIKSNVATNGNILFQIQDTSSNVVFNVRDRGTSSWRLSDSTNAHVGYVSYSTPSGLPGILISNTTSNGRSQIRLLSSSGGLGFGATTASSDPGVQIAMTTTGALTIGTISPNAASALQIDSTTRGFLPPRMTTAQRDLISSPPAGLIIYNTTTNKLNVRAASAWEEITST